jgi:hypothetical protein
MLILPFSAFIFPYPFLYSLYSYRFIHAIVKRSGFWIALKNDQFEVFERKNKLSRDICRQNFVALTSGSTVSGFDAGAVASSADRCTPSSCLCLCRVVLHGHL